MSLRQSAEDFTIRMENVLDELHNAIEQADVDSQRTGLAALVGLLEMLKSEIMHGEDDAEDRGC